MTWLKDLNEQQHEAVLHEEGPLLVLAGAGSGKTRVITSRIAHLMAERNVPAYNIMAVTFTNKAAAEMKSRVAELIDGTADEMPIIATFHSFCLRLLRQHARLLGYPNNFSIFDTDDQLALLRRILKKREHEGDTPRAIQARISYAKNSKYKAETVFGREVDQDILEIYQVYQKELKQAGAVDFDDILLQTNKLLNDHKDVREQLQRRFQHIMVDEYQDTNHPQYTLIKQLAPPQNNICAVGDDDQSIYRWRGADIANILHFSKDFPGTRVIKLERNYRSTQNILDAAHGVVEHLLGRHPKKLWTDRGRGSSISLFRGDDENSEASYVVREISSGLRKSGSENDYAILFRTNSQSRPFEEALNRHRINYQLVGGVRFYDRKEIKDVLAYVQLALNPQDSVSLLRTINNPTRGIGSVTISRLQQAAEKHDMNMMEIIRDGLQFVEVMPNAKNSLRAFGSIINSICEKIEADAPPAEVIDCALKESEYLSTLVQEGTEESMNRIDNIRELMASAKAFAAMTPGVGIAEYLDQVSLVSDTDEFDPLAPKVTLMTLHSAKGLEFPTVFLTGFEEGLLPHSRNLNDGDLLEEERRLCYVGMTRAQNQLFITLARSRRSYEGVNASRPSRFMDDIPVSVIEERGSARILEKKKQTTFGSNVENIGRFFKDRNIAVDMDKLNKHEPSSGNGFNKGDEVFLQKYGPGRIMALEGKGEDLRYIVYFPRIGQRKKLLARIAKLRKIDS